MTARRTKPEDISNMEWTRYGNKRGGIFRYTIPMSLHKILLTIEIICTNFKGYSRNKCGGSLAGNLLKFGVEGGGHVFRFGGSGV